MARPAALVPGCGICGGDPFEPEHALSADHLKQTEAGFQEAITTYARYTGWLVYHTYDSRRSDPGFPDLVLVRERVLYREVKAEGGRLTPSQRLWLERLNTAGADAGVWRPGDWSEIERTLDR